jgi:hypothetical protein
MDNKIKELEDAWIKARLANSAVEVRRREREYELMKEVRAKLDAEFGAELAATIKVEREASVVLEVEKDRVRELESLAKLPYPVGTVLVEWEYPRWSHDGSKLKKSGNRAVLQLYKQGDPLPGNSRWNRPRVGELVLRYLKKDGTPGMNVKAWQDRYEGEWMPEGVEPKKA